MVDNRIRKMDKFVELETLPEDVFDDLMKFNLRKQRIVDLCNEVLGDDPLEGEKAYSSFHRAMDGHEAYVGIVRALVDLRDDQRMDPGKYLPDEGPGEDLAKWMAQIAKATWWYNLLDLDMTQSTLNAWFSGRGKRERPDVREQVEAWWARLSNAAFQARRMTEGNTRDLHHKSELERSEYNSPRPKKLSWDTWCKDLIEDGLSMDDVRTRFVAENLLVIDNSMWVETIDLADPQDPLSYKEVRGQFDVPDSEHKFSELVDRNFECAASRTPTDFDPEPYYTDDKWGDRRDETCPKDLNGALYNLHYRTKHTRFWDADNRCVDSETEIVAVSKDGVTWEDPTERQKQGWDRGFDEWLVAMDAGKNTDNSYTQELEKAERAVREIEGRLSRGRILPEEVSALGQRLVEAREESNWRYTKTDW